MSFDNAVQVPSKKTHITKAVGGTFFVAPEVYTGRYNKKVDEFAAGVLMYYMLGGFKFPFKFTKSNNDKELYLTLIQQELSFKDRIWDKYDHFIEIQQVLEGLLNKDPARRISAKKALKHPLFKLAKMDMRETN